MCVNISSIKRIFSNQSHYFPDIPCISLQSYVEATEVQYCIDLHITVYREDKDDRRIVSVLTHAAVISRTVKVNSAQWNA